MAAIAWRGGKLLPVKATRQRLPARGRVGMALALDSGGPFWMYRAPHTRHSTMIWSADDDLVRHV
jgi:hypothetical protein